MALMFFKENSGFGKAIERAVTWKDINRSINTPLAVIICQEQKSHKEGDSPLPTMQ